MNENPRFIQLSLPSMIKSSSLKNRLRRAVVGLALGAVTGAVVLALFTFIDAVVATLRKEPGADLGLLTLVIALIASTIGALWGALFGAIVGFSDLPRPLSALLGIPFALMLCHELSRIFYGFSPLLQLACFPLMIGASFFGPSFINRFLK